MKIMHGLHVIGNGDGGGKEKLRSSGGRSLVVQ